jgi:hypothetical protein
MTVVFTLLEFLVSWIAGSIAVYFLLFAYERFRPRDYTRSPEPNEWKEIAWTMSKLSAQAGFVIALFVYIVRHAG